MRKFENLTERKKGTCKGMVIRVTSDFVNSNTDSEKTVKECFNR